MSAAAGAVAWGIETGHTQTAEHTRTTWACGGNSRAVAWAIGKVALGSRPAVAAYKETVSATWVVFVTRKMTCAVR